MAERKYKCKLCNDRKLQSEMTKVGDRYYCNGKCLDYKIKDDKSKEIENKEWEELFEYIKELHGLVIMPKQVIFRLQDLRAGHATKNGKRMRLWKSGVSYGVMREAYDLANKNIQWAINKKFGDRDVKEVMYCMAIMIGEINTVIGNRERRERQEKERLENKKDLTSINLDIPEFTRKKSNNNIESFLD